MRELTDSDFVSVPLSEPAFFEAVVDQQGGRKMRHGPINWHNVGDWINLVEPHEFPEMHRAPTQHQISLRVFHIPLGLRSAQINAKRESWEILSSQFELHDSTAEAFLDVNGAFGFYSYRSTDGTRSIERVKIIVKVANKMTIGYQALSLVFDFSKLTIKALIHGALPAQWDSFINLLCDSLHLCHHPLLLPTVLFVSHRLEIDHYRKRIDDSILQMERETGFGVAGILTTDQDRTFAQQSFSLESALVQLQSQQTELATLANVSRFSDRFSDFLFNSISRLNQTLRTSDHHHILELEDEIFHMLELPRSQAKSALSQIQSLKERVQSQTSLIFSLISSEENRTSRFVAEESAKVAIASKRDSMAMKTVAVLTMIFLPGTFVAAFLSMPFFEWNADTGSYPSSTPFQWIYWAITLPLTIALMVGWQVWWKMEDKLWNTELDEAKKEARFRLSGRTYSE
ncbi:hypothetical protein BKA67DRAFT_562158 [Truncatella angustata]|uniref:Mg2+ transporter protein, CorA-like/Zinc transport protein ZntB n=1 Tax=Truncatella angustata TaxID=152316 RepID=A0A9P8ZZC2_9PEZI|nr:uncharacterized protein BKA67DRAFT_562158 [Truncatella angustata]KAH6655913.1 hypothetical protein BKA67DRAFT_562158 [Truncatella angustata]